MDRKKKHTMEDTEGDQNENLAEGCSEAAGSSVDPEEPIAEPPPAKKSSTADEKKVLEELKSMNVPSECLKYAERWIKDKNVDPNEIQQFVYLVYNDAEQKNKNGDKPSEAWDHPGPEDKSSGLSFRLSSFNPWSSGANTPTVTLSFVVTGQTFGAHRTIINHLKIKQLKLSEINSHKQHKSQGIIVFCPITSRAGSDVEAAMRNPAVSSSDKPLILVLLYHTRDVDYCTAGKKCSEMFPRVQAEVHFLFHETQMGLIRSEQNNQAAYELKEAICNTFDLS